MSCPLDCNGERSLVLCAVTGDPSGKDLASLGNVSAELIAVLVVDHIILAAEHADFFPSAHPSLFLREIRLIRFIECHNLTSILHSG